MMKLVMYLKRMSTTVILENSRIDYWNPYANNTDTATPKRTRPDTAEATDTNTAWSTRPAA